MSVLHEISDGAKARFAEIPFPHRKDEYWRFADYDAWGVDALFPYFQNSSERGAQNAEMRELEKGANMPHTAVLFDGQLVYADVPEGVEILSMGQAAESHPENVKEFYSKTDGKFDTLQATRPASGVYIRVNDGVRAELGLTVVSKMNLSVAGAIIDLGKGATLKLKRLSLCFGGSFSVFRAGYFCGENSSLELWHVKKSEEAARAYEREDFYARENAKIADALAQVGASNSRHERNFEILAGNADIDTRIFFCARGGVTHDLRTKQLHRIGGSHSNLAVRAAMNDSAKLAFAGLVRVEPNAQKTRAYQSCRSLMLSNESKSQATPILEICANDVECSHGCTVARPDAEVMFYMEQRGLSPARARALLVQSFAQSTFEKMSDAETVISLVGECGC